MAFITKSGIDFFRVISVCSLIFSMETASCLYTGDMYMCQVLCFSSLLSVDTESKTLIKVVEADRILI